jgi:hypothetical protein
MPTAAEASERFAEALTTGTERFYEAESLQEEGRAPEARAIYEELARRFDGLWMGRVSVERLRALGAQVG